MLVSSLALANYDKEKPKGFLWYEDLPKIMPKKEQETKNMPPPVQAPTNARTRNKDLKQKLDDAIQVMLDVPTVENAIYAQRMQKQVMDRSEQVSKAWLLAALVDQELLNPKDNPNVLHRELAKQTNSIEQQATLKEIAKNWGLLFYVRSRCNFCTRFAPIVKEFADFYQFQVLAVSEGGYDYGPFVGAKDTGLIAQINPKKETPMLYLVHKDGKQIYPVARGLTDSEKIKDNILLLIELQRLKA